ncbi:MAG: serine hydrolase [bacterium]|nr:serine hydrolase [bacterium]
MSKRGRFPLVALIVVTGSCAPPTADESSKGPQSVGREPLPIAALERSIPEIMNKAGVPGVSSAILGEGKVAWVGSFGVRSTASGETADSETVFAAASLSKPLFAYLVMLLAQEGTLELDRPFEDYLGRPIGEHPRYADLAGDERTGLITARHALSHTIGFPNWRFLTDDGKLGFLVDPGTRFNYSGEGIALLQKVVEKVTGRGLEELARDKVFSPLGMSRTSYVWQAEFEDNHAVPHDEFERPKRLNRRREADAAGSMMTTAGDYARFLAGLLRAEGARRETVEAMLTPQVMINSQQMFGPRSWQQTTANEPIALAWGLGWGRFDTGRGRAFFHTGHDFGWQNYTVTHADEGVGVVFLSNSDNFESIAREMVAAALGDELSPFEWLGYPVFDPSRRREPPPDPIAIELDNATLERYVGEYAFQGDRRIKVRRIDDGLWISEGDEDPSEMLAESETDFFIIGEDMRFHFEVTDSGTVDRLLILVEGLQLPAERLPTPGEN